MLDAGPWSVSSEVVDCHVPSQAMMIRLGLARPGREMVGCIAMMDYDSGDGG